MPKHLLSLSICSAAPGVLTPLLACRSETETEAHGAVAAGGLDPVPNRGTGDARRVAPGTTAYDAVGGRGS